MQVKENIVKEVEDFIKEVKSKKTINIDDSIKLLKELGKYFDENTSDLDLDALEDFVDGLTQVYIREYESKGLSEEELEQFRDVLNSMFVIIDYLPLRKDGKDMTNKEFKEWKIIKGKASLSLLNFIKDSEQIFSFHSQSDLDGEFEKEIGKRAKWKGIHTKAFLEWKEKKTKFIP